VSAALVACDALASGRLADALSLMLLHHRSWRWVLFRCGLTSCCGLSVTSHI